MVNRSYGTVRKKSNQTAADRAASAPARRLPMAATATTTTTRTRAAFVFEKLPRNGTSTAATASGATTAATIAVLSRVRR